MMTLINVFTVPAEHQQELLDLLAEVTEQAMTSMPGFVSANLHRSDDGTRVINYAQWRSRLQDERAREHMPAPRSWPRSTRSSARSQASTTCDVPGCG
jgi:heme-degrading monooxygenase HmoA